MVNERSLSAEQLRELSTTIHDAILELQVQRRRIVVRSGPTAAEALDLGHSIERLQRQEQLIESILLPAARPPEQPVEEAPTVEEEEVEAPTALELRLYYEYYWFGISADQINIWVFWYDTSLPDRPEASAIFERAIKRLGGGYWQLVQDSTHPPNEPLLYREGEDIEWGWDSGEQEESVLTPPGNLLDLGDALIRKEKIEDWLEHPEPQRPKEIVVRVERIKGGP